MGSESVAKIVSNVYLCNMFHQCSWLQYSTAVHDISWYYNTIYQNITLLGLPLMPKMPRSNVVPTPRGSSALERHRPTDRCWSWFGISRKRWWQWQLKKMKKMMVIYGYCSWLLWSLLLCFLLMILFDHCYIVLIYCCYWWLIICVEADVDGRDSNRKQPVLGEGPMRGFGCWYDVLWSFFHCRNLETAWHFNVLF